MGDAPLWARTLAVKAGAQLAGGEMRERVAPISGYPGQRGENEASFAETGVRDRQAGRGVEATAPADNVEIERTRTPALAGAAAGIALDCLEMREELWRCQIAFNNRYDVDVAALRRTERWRADQA